MPDLRVVEQPRRDRVRGAAARRAPLAGPAPPAPRRDARLADVGRPRTTTGVGIGELDRVLGGGLVPGSWSSSAASRGSASPRSSSRRPRAVTGRSPPGLRIRRGNLGRPGPPGGGPGPPIPHRSRRGPARGPTARDAAAAWRRSVDLPIPGSPPTRTSEPGTSPPPRTRSSSPIPIGRRGDSAATSARGVARRRGQPGRGRPSRATRAARGRRSRRGCSTPRRRGTGPPSAGRRRRRTGRRSGSGLASLGHRRRVGRPSGLRPASSPRRRGSRGRLPSRSTTIVVPGSYLPSRRCSARTSSTMFWITRRSGRAP